MFEDAHPLATDLLRLRSAGDRVLLLGVGSGRNVAPLLRAGLRVDVVDADAARLDLARERFPDDARSGALRLASTLAELGDEPGDRAAAGAALSTHALLHGRPEEIAATLEAVSRRLAAPAELFATFGSRRDPRFGRGRRLDASTWAAESGPEAGVPHAFFDRAGLGAVLGAFRIESAEERPATETVGRWAHEPGDAATIVHWFVRARSSGGARTS